MFLEDYVYLQRFTLIFNELQHFCVTLSIWYDAYN